MLKFIKKTKATYNNYMFKVCQQLSNDLSSIVIFELAYLYWNEKDFIALYTEKSRIQIHYFKMLRKSKGPLVFVEYLRIRMALKKQYNDHMVDIMTTENI